MQLAVPFRLRPADEFWALMLVQVLAAFIKFNKLFDLSTSRNIESVYMHLQNY